MPRKGFGHKGGKGGKMLCLKLRADGKDMKNVAPKRRR